MKTLEDLAQLMRERIKIARDNEAYAANPERQDWHTAHDAKVTAESLEYAVSLVDELIEKQAKKKEAKAA